MTGEITEADGTDGNPAVGDQVVDDGVDAAQESAESTSSRGSRSRKGRKAALLASATAGSLTSPTHKVAHSGRSRQRVAVIIPAKDEASRIAATVRSARAIPHVDLVLVVGEPGRAMLAAVRRVGARRGPQRTRSTCPSKT